LYPDTKPPSLPVADLTNNHKQASDYDQLISFLWKITPAFNYRMIGWMIAPSALMMLLPPLPVRNQITFDERWPAQSLDCTVNSCDWPVNCPTTAE